MDEEELEISLSQRLSRRPRSGVASIVFWQRADGTLAPQLQAALGTLLIFVERKVRARRPHNGEFFLLFPQIEPPFPSSSPKRTNDRKGESRRASSGQCIAGGVSLAARRVLGLRARAHMHSTLGLEGEKMTTEERRKKKTEVPRNGLMRVRRVPKTPHSRSAGSWT